METKFTVNEVLTINQIVKNLIDDETLSINYMFKFKLLGIVKALEPFVTNFEVIRNEKIVEYGEKNDEGVSINPEDKEKMDGFTKDIQNLLSEEVYVNIKKLKAEDVFNQGLSSNYLIGLYPIIDCEQ